MKDVLLSVDTFENKPYTLIDYYFRITHKYKNPKPTDIHFPAANKEPLLPISKIVLLYITYKKFAESNLTADIPDRKYSIYEVSVTSPNEKFTKVFTDKIVAET